MGLVVQCIVSLRKSLVKNLLRLIVLTKSTGVIFFAENCEELLKCKSSSHLFGKMAVFLCFNI